MKRTGLFGGTFDPIHTGHLIVAEEIRERIGLDQIIFIPARIPPHKISVSISAESYRMDMVRLATKTNPHFVVEDVELRRQGFSYTIDTVKHFMNQQEVYLIMGHDSFVAIETWYEYEKLLSLCKIIVAFRPGAPDIQWADFSPAVRKYYPGRVCKCANGPVEKEKLLSDWRICLIDIPGLNISASEIRQRIKTHRSIRYLVPAEVRDYIYKNKLYSGGRIENPFNK